MFCARRRAHANAAALAAFAGRNRGANYRQIAALRLVLTAPGLKRVSAGKWSWFAEGWNVKNYIPAKAGRYDKMFIPRFFLLLYRFHCIFLPCKSVFH